MQTLTTHQQQVYTCINKIIEANGSAGNLLLECGQQSDQGRFLRMKRTLIRGFGVWDDV